MQVQEQASLRPITLLVCALGGEGGGVLAEWIIHTAIAAGYPAQSTAVPGVAQRTGATTYYIEVFPQPESELQGKRPVFGLNPIPGALDALVSSELLETVRQISNGFSTPDRTLLITSSSRALTTLERMEPGDGRYPTEQLLDIVRENSREHHIFDMAKTAQEAGTVISAVLLGAIAASGLFPFSREAYEATVKASGRGVEASLRGFAKAYEIVESSRRQGELVQQILQLDEQSTSAAPTLPSDVAAQFPEAAHDVLRLAYDRLVDYQNKGYARLYVERLKKVLEAEKKADPTGTHGYATTREAARYLALWMAFDDVIRVAHLKSRAARYQRVLQEVRAQPDDIVRVYDHFKPGVPEFAGLLPKSLARPLMRWDSRRQLKGKRPWAMPLKIGSHSVFGMLMLRTMAGMKSLRKLGSRYQSEQAMIERWLNAVERGTVLSWRLGNEIALCGRLIKGYGETNERGKENLLHVLDHLVEADRFEDPEQRAQAVADVRKAALADAAGKDFDASLQRYGAPARPMKETPIRWVKRVPAAPSK